MLTGLYDFDKITSTAASLATKVMLLQATLATALFI
jgi:hypothetical protein